MSFPNIPDVDASIGITREDSLNLILASIAFEELGLAHVINAEAEKIQYVLGTIGGQEPLPIPPTVTDLLAVDDSVRQVLKNVILKEMLLQFKLEDILPRICVSSTFDFPSINSTVVGSSGFIDDTAVGYFWSVARGDGVSETFSASNCINNANLKIEVLENVLAPSAFVDWELVINGVVVGSFTVEAGFTGELFLNLSFPKITGPIYQVDLRVTNEVPSGSGSISLAYASDFAHSITLTCCPDLGADVATTEIKTKNKRPSNSQQNFSLALNNRDC